MSHMSSFICMCSCMWGTDCRNSQLQLQRLGLYRSYSDRSYCLTQGDVRIVHILHSYHSTLQLLLPQLLGDVVLKMDRQFQDVDGMTRHPRSCKEMKKFTTPKQRYDFFALTPEATTLVVCSLYLSTYDHTTTTV